MNAFSKLPAIKRFALRRMAVRANVHINEKFHVGPGSVIWAPTGLDIGRNVYIGKNVTVQVDGQIGDEVLVANNVGIVGKLDHDYLQVGTPVRSSAWVGENAHLSRPILIGSDTWIGYGAIICSGVTIGNSSIIAAGSLVVENVQENAIMVGSPARFLKFRFSEEDFVNHWNRLTANGTRRLPMPPKLEFPGTNV